MDYKPCISLIINGNTFSYRLFEALEIISSTYSQRKAAQKIGVSHAVLNRSIKDAEKKLGFELVTGSGAGSLLTPEAQNILKRYKEYNSKLKKHDKIIICGGYASSRLMEILAEEYGLNAAVYKTGDKNALYLAKFNMVDILTLDDPVHALIGNLDFTPIAYDYLVLISSENKNMKNIDDLKNINFFEIEDSPQRLAWNTLDDNKIPYKLKDGFKSPYDALRFIKNTPDSYTFISHSIEEGSEIIKDDTRHIISFITCNREDKRIEDFLKFILTFKGQKIVQKSGFEKIR